MKIIKKNIRAAFEECHHLILFTIAATVKFAENGEVDALKTIPELKIMHTRGLKAKRALPGRYTISKLVKVKCESLIVLLYIATGAASFDKNRALEHLEDGIEDLVDVYRSAYEVDKKVKAEIALPIIGQEAKLDWKIVKDLLRELEPRLNVEFIIYNPDGRSNTGSSKTPDPGISLAKDLSPSLIENDDKGKNDRLQQDTVPTALVESLPNGKST